MARVYPATLSDTTGKGDVLRRGFSASLCLCFSASLGDVCSPATPRPACPAASSPAQVALALLPLAGLAHMHSDPIAPNNDSFAVAASLFLPRGDSTVLTFVPTLTRHMARRTLSDRQATASTEVSPTHGVYCHFVASRWYMPHLTQPHPEQTPRRSPQRRPTLASTLERAPPQSSSPPTRG
jgi:hypothetical protein